MDSLAPRILPGQSSSWELDLAGKELILARNRTGHKKLGKAFNPGRTVPCGLQVTGF